MKLSIKVVHFYIYCEIDNSGRVPRRLATRFSVVMIVIYLSAYNGDKDDGISGQVFSGVFLKILLWYEVKLKVSSCISLVAKWIVCYCVKL